MASKIDTQSNHNNELTPFVIANDCPQENIELIYRIILNLKRKLFKETDHIQQIKINRNHLTHYLPVILLNSDRYNRNYTFVLTNENNKRRTYFNFQNETTLSEMLKIFLKRHEESQDRTKLTAITSTTYNTIRSTSGYLNESRQQVQSVNDRLRFDIKNYNNWLTKIIELKPEIQTASIDIIKIVSEFTFLFWLDNFEHINEKRIQFGETYPDEIGYLCDELKNIWDKEYCSENFESTLQISSDSINFIEGLENYVKILDQGQSGSSSFNITKSSTSTSTPKDTQLNSNSQVKQKSTIKPDKLLTSNLFGNNNNTIEDVENSDSDEREIRSDNKFPPSVNQNRRKYQYKDEINSNRMYINSVDNKYRDQEQNWEQQQYNYEELKNEITQTVTKHTNKLINNLEEKYQRMSRNMEKRQEEALEMVINKLDRTLDNLQGQNNYRTEYEHPLHNRNQENPFHNRNYEHTTNENIQNTDRHSNQQQGNQNRRTNSITTEEREITVVEPPLPFYKQLTSMSINEDPQIEQNISSGSVPTTIRPFDGTDPAYTVEEYLNSIVAAMIFSSGIEPVNKPGHHQWKVKRAALILHTLQGPAQKWYSTLPSETKLDWETFCKEFSDMFDSEKSKQQAKIILQQLQKHTNESLRSLALRIETLVKTAYSLYTEDYRNSVMNQTFIRCLDNELKNAALKKHANHKQTPREPEMPFKTLVEKIDQMDLTRTISNNHKRLYEVNQSTTNINEDLKQMNIACNNINELNQNDLEQFEGTICNVLNGINNTYDKKNFKGRPKFALFCSYCSSHGHTKGRCFKRPRQNSVTRPKERSFYSHMRNNQNLPNRRIDSNNVNGRQLPPTSPVYNNSRSRTPYRSHSRNNYHNRNSRDSRNNQGYQRSNNYNNRSTSYNRNNYNRNRSNSYHRSNSHNKYNNTNNRPNSRYNDRNKSRQQSPYNSNKNNNSNNNNNNRQRYNSRDSNRNDNYRQRSNSNNRNHSNNNSRDNRGYSSQREQNKRHYSKERRNDGNNNSKNRINSVGQEKTNNDPPGIDEYEYTSESSDEDQEILDKFYNANEDTCNTVINTLESNPTWILPMYQYQKFEQDFTKQKPMLEIDFLLDSGATLNLLNEDTWNEIKYNNPEMILDKASKTLTAANNTKIDTFGTVTLNLTPDRISNNRNKPQNNFCIHFYVTQCNHNILGTPFFKEYIETINVNTNKLTLNTNTNLDNDIKFYMNSTKSYPYYSRLYTIINRGTIYIEPNQQKSITFPIPIFEQMKYSNDKTIQKSKFYFEPINKYHNVSFTDIKDFSSDEEYFMDILLINKNRHRITINTVLIGFMNRNISFKKQDNELYQTNSIDLFQALYHLTYENENDIDEILNIQENETIEQVATFERKPNFKCKFNINKYSEQEKEFIKMFDFQHHT